VFSNGNIGKRLSKIHTHTEVSCPMAPACEYLVVSHDDIQIDQFGSFGTFRFEIVPMVDMWGIAVVIRIPG
jgi:hypothetical protein